MNVRRKLSSAVMRFLSLRSVPWSQMLRLITGQRHASGGLGFGRICSTKPQGGRRGLPLPQVRPRMMPRPHPRRSLERASSRQQPHRVRDHQQRHRAAVVAPVPQLPMLVAMRRPALRRRLQPSKPIAHHRHRTTALASLLTERLLGCGVRYRQQRSPAAAAAGRLAPAREHK